MQLHTNFFEVSPDVLNAMKMVYQYRNANNIEINQNQKECIFKITMEPLNISQIITTLELISKKIITAEICDEITTQISGSSNQEVIKYILERTKTTSSSNDQATYTNLTDHIYKNILPSYHPIIEYKLIKDVIITRAHNFYNYLPEKYYYYALNMSIAFYNSTAFKFLISKIIKSWVDSSSANFGKIGSDYTIVNNILITLALTKKYKNILAFSQLVIMLQYCIKNNFKLDEYQWRLLEKIDSKTYEKIWHIEAEITHDFSEYKQATTVLVSESTTANIISGNNNQIYFAKDYDKLLHDSETGTSVVNVNELKNKYRLLQSLGIMNIIRNTMRPMKIKSDQESQISNFKKDENNTTETETIENNTIETETTGTDIVDDTITTSKNNTITTQSAVFYNQSRFAQSLKLLNYNTERIHKMPSTAYYQNIITQHLELWEPWSLVSMFDLSREHGYKSLEMEWNNLLYSDLETGLMLMK